MFQQPRSPKKGSLSLYLIPKTRYLVGFSVKIFQSMWINSSWVAPWKAISLLECVSLTISYHLHFLRISQVSSMLHHGSVGQVQSKECYFIITYTFLAFFCCFTSKICVFIIFISFFDEVSNFGNRILNSQKPE